MSEQVDKWLDGIGLAQYKANFVEHQVGMQILTEIGDVDLFGTLGHPLPLGHRRLSPLLLRLRLRPERVHLIAQPRQ